MKNLKLYKKISVLSMASLLGFASIGYSVDSKEEYSINEIIDMYNNNIGLSNYDLINLETLVVYVDLTDKINSLNLEKDAIKLAKFSDEEMKNYNYLNNTDVLYRLLLDVDFNKNSSDSLNESGVKYKDAVRILYYNAGLMNKYIYYNGYNIVRSLLEKTIKSKVLDTSLAISELDVLNKGDYYYLSYLDKYGNNGKFDLINTKLYKLLDNIKYIDLNRDEFVDIDRYNNKVYSKNSNELIKKFLENVEDVIRQEFKLDNNNRVIFSSEIEPKRFVKDRCF